MGQSLPKDLHKPSCQDGPGWSVAAQVGRNVGLSLEREIRALQRRVLWTGSLSGLPLWNLREMLEKSLEEGELGSVSTLSYLVQGTFLEGTMVCSVIKSYL